MRNAEDSDQRRDKVNCKYVLHSLSLIHKSPSVFAVSQWQTNKSKPNVKYLLYRFTVMLQFLTIIIISLVSHYKCKRQWIVYATNWGYVFCTIQAVLAFILVASTFNNSKLQKKVYKVYPVYWLTNTIASPAALAITIIYWIDREETSFEAVDFMVHGNNSIMMLLDICITAHPSKILHFVYPMMFGLTYSFFTLIYFYVGSLGFLGKYKSIYKRLDWEQPLSTALICLGVTTFMIILHLIVVMLVFVRTKIAKKVFGSSTSRSESVANGKVHSKGEFPQMSTA